MNSLMSKRISDFSLPNKNSASARATSVLPTPVGPKNRNDPAGRFGDFNPARERRMARASADIAFRHHAGRGVVEIVFLAELAQILALLALLIRIEARLLEFVIRDGVLHAMRDELDALLDVGDFARQRGLPQLHARAGFIDQIDRLVGQEAIRNK